MVGREMLNDRPAILLTFRPRQTFKPKTEEGQRMRHVAGRAWINENDHELARLHLEVIDPISIGWEYSRNCRKARRSSTSEDNSMTRFGFPSGLKSRSIFVCC